MISDTCSYRRNQRRHTACGEMVNFDSLIARSKVIHILGSEGSDSEIMSDCDTESVEDEDHCRTLEDVMRY